MTRAAPRMLFMLGKTQAENLGDCLLGRFLASELRGHGALRIAAAGLDADYLDMLASPPEEHLAVGRGGLYLNAWSAARGGRAPLIAFNAGHYYGVQGGRETMSAALNVAMLAALDASGVRLVRFGASIGPFGPVRLQVERWRARVFDYYGLRDSISLTYARDNGFSNVERCPDLGFLAAQDPLFSALPAAQRRHVALSFRAETLRDRTGGSIRNALVARLRELLPVIRELDLEPVLVAQVRSDGAFMAELGQTLGIARAPVVFAHSTLADARAVIDIYRQSRLILSNRLHSLLFAAAAGALPMPLTSFAQHRKITGIFHDEGLLELGMDLDHEGDGPAHVRRVVAAEGEWRSRIERSFAGRAGEIRTIIRDVASAGDWRRG